MNFSEKLLKWGSYIFIGFITLLIIISFGMPDFIGTRGQQTQFLAAEVDGNKISKKEVANYKSQLAQQYGGGANIPDSFLAPRALEIAINRKLIELLAQEAGFYPRGEKLAVVRKDFLLNNFERFKTPQGFKLKEFKEFLVENGYSYSDILDDAVKDYSIQRINELMNKIAFGSDLDALEKLRLNQVIVSYRVIAIDAKKKDEILKELAGVSEKEIQEMFQKDYKSKDAKSKLTKTKRQAIEKKIFNSKKSTIEKEWFTGLQELAQKGNLETIARRNATKVYNLNKVPLSQSLDKAKQKDVAASLASLEGNETFRNQLFSAPLKSVIGPIKDNNVIYLVSITERKIGNLPSASQLIASKKRLNQFLADLNFDASDFVGQVKDQHFRISSDMMTQLLKNDAKILRYQEAPTPGR